MIEIEIKKSSENVNVMQEIKIDGIIKRSIMHQDMKVDISRNRDIMDEVEEEIEGYIMDWRVI